MHRRAYLDNHGFTLMEVLVAIVIMMVGLLALLQTVNYAIVHNMTNQLRNEGVLEADRAMALQLTRPFDSISTNTSTAPVFRPINNAFRSYSVTRIGTSVSDSTKSVEIVVRWHFKGQSYSHSISSLISKFNQ